MFQVGDRVSQHPRPWRRTLAFDHLKRDPTPEEITERLSQWIDHRKNYLPVLWDFSSASLKDPGPLGRFEPIESLFPYRQILEEYLEEHREALAQEERRRPRPLRIFAA
jgi:hypothetical protein